MRLYCLTHHSTVCGPVSVLYLVLFLYYVCGLISVLHVVLYHIPTYVYHIPTIYLRTYICTVYSPISVMCVWSYVNR